MPIQPKIVQHLIGRQKPKAIAKNSPGEQHLPWKVLVETWHSWSPKPKSHCQKQYLPWKVQVEFYCVMVLNQAYLRGFFILVENPAKWIRLNWGKNKKRKFLLPRNRRSSLRCKYESKPFHRRSIPRNASCSRARTVIQIQIHLNPSESANWEQAAADMQMGEEGASARNAFQRQMDIMKLQIQIKINMKYKYKLWLFRLVTNCESDYLNCHWA